MIRQKAAGMTSAFWRFFPIHGYLRPTMQFPEFPIAGEAAPEIAFHFEDIEFTLPDPTELGAWIQTIAQAETKEVLGLDIIFCTDEYLRAINVEHLEHDYYTDIITFPYTEGAVHGDLFISAERVQENAETHGVAFLQELCRVIAHGVLHLAGYGDKTAEEQITMRAKEDLYLNQCPVLPPTSNI